MNDQLRKMATKCLKGCQSLADDGITIVYAPDAAGYYKGIYWRDFCYALEGFGEDIPVEHIEGAIRFILDAIDPGATIMPKSRQSDGRLDYNRDQNGQFRSADNAFFAIKVVDIYLKRDGSPELFDEYRNRLEPALFVTNLSPRHLVQNDIGSSLYGFFDTINLTGEEAFVSVLFVEACFKIADALKRIGQENAAKHWHDRGMITCNALQHLWVEEAGMLLSDTGTNQQIDIWTSAYAAATDILPKEKSRRVADWLEQNWKSAVRWGHVRAIPSPEYWKGAFARYYPKIIPNGYYQNGGYWSVAAPWVMSAIIKQYPALAQQMACELEEALVEFKMPETINEDGSCKLSGYVASAAMGTLALKIAMQSLIESCNVKGRVHISSLASLKKERTGGL